MLFGKRTAATIQAKDKRIANLAVSLARYEPRLESLERFVTPDKRIKRQVTARVNSTRKRGLRRATPSKAD